MAEVGATLRSWRVGGRELLDSFAAELPAHGHRGKVLMPWPNRDARRPLRLRRRRAAASPCTSPSAATRCTASSSGWPGAGPPRQAARTLAQPPAPARPGYLSRSALAVGYELDRRAASRSRWAPPTRARRAAPFGAGLHPYLAPRAAASTTQVLRASGATRAAVDDRLIPDRRARARRRHGARLPRGPARSARWSSTTASRSSSADGDGLARVASIAGGARGSRSGWTALRPPAGLHRATRSRPARRRRSVAVEPMTCAPDAFNSGDGLLVLAGRAPAFARRASAWPIAAAAVSWTAAAAMPPRRPARTARWRARAPRARSPGRRARRPRPRGRRGDGRQRRAAQRPRSGAEQQLAGGAQVPADHDHPRVEEVADVADHAADRARRVGDRAAAAEVAGQRERDELLRGHVLAAALATARRTIAGPEASVSRQPRLPQRQIGPVSSTATWPISPAMPPAPR